MNIIVRSMLLLFIHGLLFIPVQNCFAEDIAQVEIGTLSRSFDLIANAVVAIRPGETALLKMKGGVITESAILNVQDAAISITAGYDPTFTAQSGMYLNTTLIGDLSISNCLVTVTTDPLFVSSPSSAMLIVAGEVTVFSGELVADSLVIQ